MKTPFRSNRAENWLLAITAYAFLLGLAARLFPLTDLQHRLFWQYMTEDGYLLQTVARNLAGGLGMSVSAGTIPTNGVQPLFTFVSALLFKLVSGDKADGIILVTLVSLLIALLSTWLLQRIARRLFDELGLPSQLTWLAAALWFAAPHIIRHSMNGLETGLYWLMMLLTVNYWLAASRESASPLTLAEQLSLGVLLGLTFLARNDAVFFIAALLLSHLLVRPASSALKQRVIEALVAGATSVVVASPWLINNYRLFGSIVPISGKAESYGAHFGHNLLHVPATFIDSALLYAPIPSSLESNTTIALIMLLATLGIAAGVRTLAAYGHAITRQILLLTLILSLEISAYYGLMFGATHFMQRYFSVLTPLLWISVFAWAARLALRSQTVWLLPLFALLATGIASGFAVRDWQRGYALGTAQEHENVVQWVQANVPDSDWVGAVQSGTLGYFHDRTINLDGKVNPAALQAKIQHGNVLDYVIHSPIVYIADWSSNGFAAWTDPTRHPDFARQFQVIYRNDRDNVMVMQRITKPDATSLALTGPTL